MTTLRGMKLHDIIDLDEGDAVLRVPGGWVYRWSYPKVPDGPAITVSGDVLTPVEATVFVPEVR